MTSETLTAFQLARPRGQDLPAKPATRKAAPVRSTTRVMDVNGQWRSKLAPNNSQGFAIEPARMSQVELAAHRALRDSRDERSSRAYR